MTPERKAEIKARIERHYNAERQAMMREMMDEIEKSHKRIENLRYVLIKLSSSTDSKMTEMDCNYAMDADNEAASEV